MIERDHIKSAAPIRSHSETLDYRTASVPEFVDITDDLAAVVEDAGVFNGIAVVFSRHTTAAIKINENEPELLKDMARFLSEIAPQERDYYHNNFNVRTVNMQDDEVPNAHSHCQQLMLSTSESIPVVNGRLALGTWQRIFLVELDRPKPRQVTVQILGM